MQLHIRDQNLKSNGLLRKTFYSRQEQSLPFTTGREKIVPCRILYLAKLSDNYKIESKKFFFLKFRDSENR